ncbi:MAG: TonB-dependent receptor [Planctomycetes bacterium]|nr:TonB-dependent receptor [Planctomycetota bacterium]
MSSLAPIAALLLARAPQEPPADEPRPIVPVAPVVVTPTRGAESSLEVPASVTVRDLERIRRMVPQSTPDALREVPGLNVQKSNQGGGSPILRGRSGKDVLLLIDGQRFSNTTFRRNHQYLNTLDLFALDGIEVVHGPASVLYGSDAMGGAVNLLGARRPIEGVDDWGGRVYLQHDTVNAGLIGHVDANAEWDGWGLLAGFTSRHLADVSAGRVGGDPIGAVDRGGEQEPTGYRERDLNLSLTRQLGDHDTLDYLLLYSRQWNVPASERLIANDENPNPSDLQRDFDPQRLRWHQLRWRHEDEGALLESAQAIASLNAPVEGRRRVRASSPSVTTVERDEVMAPGLSLQAGLRVDPAHLLTVGAEGYFERINPDSYTIDSAANTVTPGASGRYPDGARYDTLGVYAQDEWRFGDGWEWVNGVRASRVAVDLDFEGLTVGTAGPFGKFDEEFDDVTFATGLSKQFDDTRSLYVSLSRGFRAPNLDDLAVVGDFAAGDRVPNFAVDAEKVWNAELGAKQADARTTAQAALAVAWYEDLLTNEFAFTSGGTDYFVVDNAGRAVIYSAELAVAQVVNEADSLGLRHTLELQASASFGRNRSDREPVSKIPAPEGLLAWRVDDEAASRPWWAEAYARGALAQRRLAAVDKADPRFPDSGTPAWWTFNLRTGLEVARATTLTLALENLFNYRYRLHGSGIDAPGRNFITALEWRF